ncbi:glycoside hydrolase family 43 [methanotrophic bacterial endosymbiont of Bathymodiolus sp.]|nr:glycoside hydrolase family 43 [methanotrophic bacterial endosymbiont of Bathymodiolus sp.]
MNINILFAFGKLSNIKKFHFSNLMALIANNYRQLCLIIALMCTTNLYAQSNPVDLVGQESIYHIGDPFIMKFKGTYYLYPSTKDSEIGIRCFTSKDLINWQYQGLVATGSVTQGAYAPEVVYENGKFYMYTSPQGNGHYVFESSAPLGPFIVKTDNLGHSIDGSVFIDDDGQWYFTHASSLGIVGHKMSDPYTITGSETLINGQMNNGWTEGSYIIKREGNYYLSYTGNHLGSRGYRVEYGINNTSPIGNYTPATEQGPVLLSTEGNVRGTGHSMTFRGPNLDEYFITYHNLVNPVGPARKLNFDRIGFAGKKMVVLGPTATEQQAPIFPTYFDYLEQTSLSSDWRDIDNGNWSITSSGIVSNDSTGNTGWFKLLTTAESNVDYTAEFNLKERYRGANDSRMGVVFDYQNENNFSIALLDSFNNRLETNYLINGTWSGGQFTNMPAGFDYQTWHTLRIEKSGSTYHFYVDSIKKLTRIQLGTSGGAIGFLTANNYADFGYVAFNNNVNGSSLYDVYKPVPGVIQAVHYNQGGEGVGYHDTSVGNIGNIFRTDNVDIRASNSEGGAIVGWNGTSEWLKYNVMIAQTGSYNLGLRYATTFTNASVRIWLDDTVDLTGVESLSSTVDWEIFTTQTIKDLQISQGQHSIKVEVVSGEFDFSQMEIALADNRSFDIVDNFNAGYSHQWNHFDGDWHIQNSQARVNGTGKITMADVGYSDYTVEVDINGAGHLDGGILVRANNPSNGGKGNDPQLGADYIQAYYIGLTNIGVILGKQNYNWQTLDYVVAINFDPQQTHHMKVVVLGAMITVYVNDMTTPLLSYTDANQFIQGKVGLRSFLTVSLFDNFHVYHASGQGTVPAHVASTFPFEDSLNGSIHPGWKSYAGNWKIQSNSVTVAADESAKALVGDKGWQNIQVDASLSYTGANVDTGVLFRANNAFPGPDQVSGYYAGIKQNSIVLGKFNGYAWSTISTIPYTINANTLYQLRVVATDDNIKVYINDMIAPVITVTDSTYKDGQVGVRSHFTSSEFHHFIATPL